MPLRVANEPYLRSFQYKVLNSILYMYKRKAERQDRKVMWDFHG